MALVIVMDSYGSVQELSTDSPQSPFVSNYFRISLGIYGKCIKFAKIRGQGLLRAFVSCLVRSWTPGRYGYHETALNDTYKQI